MLKRKKLRFGNIGRFITDQEIDFTQKGKLVQINGINKNTGGSSGAGKSTFIELTDYNLGISKSPSTLLQSRYTKEPAWTEGEYESNGTTYTIRRVKDKGLTIHWSGAENGEITGNNAVAEEKIQQILGMEPELFRRMTHKAQKEDGFFLSLTPAKSFNFLIKILGMEDMLKKIEKADSLVSEKEKELSKLEIELGTLGSKLNDQSANLENFKKTNILPEKPSADVTSEKSELKSLQDKLSQIETLKQAELSKVPELEGPAIAVVSPRAKEIEFEIEKIEKEIKAAEAEKLNKINQIRSALDVLKGEKNSAEYANKKVKELEAYLISKEKEYSHLTDKQCPTCLQKWIGLDMEAKIQSIQQEMESTRIKIDENKSQYAKLPELTEKIGRAETILTNLSSNAVANESRDKIASLRAEKDQLYKANSEENTAILTEHNKAQQARNDLINQIKSKFEKGKEILFSSIRELETKIQAAESALKMYEQSVENYNRNLALNTSILEKYEKELAEKNSVFQIAQYDFILHQEVKRFIKSFTNKKFEDALETIGKNATERLNRIPNMATASINFEPFKEVKGKIKEEIAVVLSVDGDIGIPLNSLSGGERSAVDLSVDLAVADFIEEHSGMGADYLVLDEPCAGMDTVCKQEYIEMLKSISTNKQIFIVEHSTEVKEMVDDTILVVRDGLYSKLEQ